MPQNFFSSVAFLYDEYRYIHKLFSMSKRILNFIGGLFSDSNRVSSKRFVGLLALVMFIGYGIRGMLLVPFNVQFSIFYVSLCAMTMWIAFKFMSSDKALKYNVLGSLAKFNMKDAVDQVMISETELDNAVQPPVNNDRVDVPLNS